MAPLRPAPLDHLLAVCRAHALQEPVAGFSLALVWLICSLHSARSLWFGEAGILCLMRLVVKYLIVLRVFCLAGVLGWNFAGVFLGLSVVGDCLETSLSLFVGPHRCPVCGCRPGGQAGMVPPCRAEVAELGLFLVWMSILSSPPSFLLWLIGVYFSHTNLFLYSYEVIHRCGKSCV
jgi:hypothetical protein